MVGKLSMYLQCICDVLAWKTEICPQWMSSVVDGDDVEEEVEAHC
jgi:hypothetical protein